MGDGTYWTQMKRVGEKKKMWELEGERRKGDGELKGKGKGERKRERAG